MNNIGKVIRELRLRQNLTQNQLAEGICTAKYLYLIEKGERTPSNEVMGELSRKLGEDLFDYYDYLSYENPIAVRKIMGKAEQSLRVSAYSDLTALIEEANQLPDYHVPPLSHHITYLRGIYLLQVEQNAQEARNLAQDALHSMTSSWIDSTFSLRHQNLLARSRIALEEWEEACLLSSRMIQSLDKVMNLKQNRQLVLSTYITFLITHLFSGRYSETIQKGLELMAIQAEWNLLDASAYLYFILAFAYRKNGDHQESSRMLENGILFSLLHGKEQSIADVNQRGIIDEMLTDHTLEEDLVAKFVERFGDVVTYLPMERTSHVRMAGEKKSPEAAFQSLAENLPDYLWIYNITQSRFTYASPHIVKLRGFTPEEQSKMSRADVVTPESLVMIESWIEETITKLEADPDTPVFFSGRIKQPCRGGSFIYADITVRCRVNEVGEIEVIGISRPVDGLACSPDESELI